ncbi:DUF2459 domain-containing protein [Minwuia thermotolerans]|uniref:DUF2459 domain-containing protein n=1 Tax=Minwuia thermotolerans TaxID=2056226 RepID=A0A2M9G1A2_9PROT|nr:DUF2459 domain-containing protein [Minwuia thermotolerans]PJK29486.1 hypothetical protein CVT23_10505 [Minwuia thermotolerans]
MSALGVRAALIGIGAFCMAWVGACAPAGTPVPTPDPTVDGGSLTRTVYLVRSRLHTGIVMARDALPSSHLPEAADFPDAPFLEFGWGDRDYYPDPNPTVGMGLSALMTPTEAVMKIGARGPPPFAGADDLLSLPVSDGEFGRIAEAIDASFDRPDGGRAEPIPGGRRGGRNFYPAHGRFQMFNTCNNWLARVLAAAGLDVSTTGAMTGAELMLRVRALPRVTE